VGIAETTYLQLPVHTYAKAGSMQKAYVEDEEINIAANPVRQEIPPCAPPQREDIGVLIVPTKTICLFNSPSKMVKVE
jgi:hypothetical protein